MDTYRIPGEKLIYRVNWHPFRGKSIDELKKLIKHVDPHLLCNVAGSYSLHKKKGLEILEMTKKLGVIKRPLIVQIFDDPEFKKYKWQILDGRHRAGCALALGLKTVPILEFERVSQ